MRTILREHYRKNYSNKMFSIRKIGSSDAYILYHVDNKQEEKHSFADTFVHYLPFYIRSSDQLKTINTSNIDEDLYQRSLKIRNKSEILPKRSVESDGIYGELFLDFYLRIIKMNNPIITYAQKSAFNIRSEKKGFDNIAYEINGDKIAPIFAESKFVNTKSSAKTSLNDDIIGHINKEYINRNLHFIVEKESLQDIADKGIESIKNFFNNLNDELDNGNDFLKVLIKHKIEIKIVIFAIFTHKDKEIEKYNTIYEELSNNLEVRIKELGVEHYSYEIVFIPIETASMIIKCC